ncbi:ankyrin repeat protein [Penicillium longicatenatum]|uniref:ankyrin repeat protein n=1 Tax=Penicillium longicatenatum TaxID=1561947 RepID=UPI0025492EDC|nr:ankyrin repeat protein [Penicillium longicatenatum]KAJ5636382.1 ankyrin repeat protein [Penicillium longicatenatum]
MSNVQEWIPEKWHRSDVLQGAASTLTGSGIRLPQFGEHNIVVDCLPKGKIGINYAAVVAAE